jgi:glycosyltransferase involved in cell wall biosynthesis
MKWFEFLCEYLFLQGSSLIIVPSKAAIRQFDAFHLGKKKRFVITPAPNIIHRGAASFRSTIRTLVFVGHIEWRKGLDVLVKALGRLNDLKLHLDVAGQFDGNSGYFKNVKQMIDENGLENNISFHGCLQPEQLTRLYRQADLFVFPSRHETYGMVLVEAMSFGLPIVASAIPTTMEIIENNINGVLYDTENSEALAQAIRRLASDIDFRRSIVKRNNEISRNIRTWEDVGRENFKVISRFLQDGVGSNG